MVNPILNVNPIQAGSFVVQYVGEVITSEEAEERGKKYDAGRPGKNIAN
jgi:SET domain-containing protein